MDKKVVDESDVKDLISYFRNDLDAKSFLWNWLRGLDFYIIEDMDMVI